MARVDVGGAIVAGFGLIGRKPGTVLAWGLVATAAVAIYLGGYAGFLANGIFSAPTAANSPVQTAHFFATMLAWEGCFFLGALVAGGLSVVVSSAVWRSVIHPERSAWAYLRLGVTEVFVALIMMAMAFALNIAMFPIMGVMMIAIGIAVEFKLYLVAVGIGILAIAAFVVGFVYLKLRFILLTPMIVDDGRLHFVDAWRLTHGRVGSLLLVGVGVVALTIAVEAVGLLVAAGSVVGVAALALGGAEHLAAPTGQAALAVAARLWPVLPIWLVAGVPLAGAFCALTLAPWAHAYRDLIPAAAPASG